MSENIRVENGALVLQALRTEEGEYTSARIYTNGILDFQYGEVVVEAKLPQGAGTWPAIWLRTEESTSSSIAIMEAQGARPNLIFGNVHNVVTADTGDNPFVGQLEILDLYTEFHAYGVEWEPDVIRFTLDGNVYHQVDRFSEQAGVWPFDQKFHLVINLAMGGDWSESLSQRLSLGFENGIDNSQEENWKFYIRSIRYYPYIGE